MADVQVTVIDEADHMADLGFLPAVKRLLDATPKIGQMTVKLPAKAVPAALSHLVEVYRRDRSPKESLGAFITRVGKNKLKDELIPYTIVPAYQDDPTFYYDWEGESEFILEDLGPGECAGGALEMIENGILEADQELYQAKLLVENHQYSVSVNKSYRAVLAAAKAMLVTEGLEPSTDSETFIEFDSRIAQKGVIPAQYRELNKKVGDLGPKDTTAESAREKMAFAKGFVDACRAATDQMGKDLKLAPAQEPVAPVKETVAPAPVASDDTAEFPHTELLTFEKELLGFYVSGHPLNAYRGLSEAIDTHPVDALLNQPDRTEFRLCGIASTLVKRLSKKDNRPWVAFTLATRTASLGLNMFADAFENYGQSVAENALVLVQGNIIVGQEGARINVKECYPLDGQVASLVRKVVWILHPEHPATGDFLTQLRATLDREVGETRVEFAFLFENRVAPLAEASTALGWKVNAAAFHKLRQHPAVAGVQIQ